MHLGADESTEAGQLLPVRMLNEFTYCPRLFYLEWVQGEFADNAFTVDGRFVHRRVDSGNGQAPPAEAEEPFEVRSVSLSSTQLGLSAKIDLIEGEGSSAVPVDYKRGKPPPAGPYEPERVQLCAYGLLLREHGYQCDHGVLYFAQARTRVVVPFDQPLIDRTLELLVEAKATALGGTLPPPLQASPKCQGCSLHGICLPDEVNQLRADSQSSEGAPACSRQLVPSRDDAQPLYVVEQGARVGISGEVVEVVSRDREKLADARIRELSQLVLIGNVQVSAQAVRELCGRAIPICWMSFGGWLAGMSDGAGHGNIELRRAQFRTADDPVRCLALAKRLVRNKIANCRTLLRRNHPAPENAARDLGILTDSVEEAISLQQLLGTEGNAARIYFQHFGAMLKAPAAEPLAFDFTTRSRRPPKDPVNALLSFSYSLLAKELTTTLRATGLDPFLGFYHQPRFGRPALALDLMEEFRPLIADSAVLSMINTGVVSSEDFVRSSLGCALKPDARKRVLRAYERRLDEEVTHPVFGYRISYRRVLEVQCRLLGRHLMGELPSYPEFRTR